MANERLKARLEKLATQLTVPLRLAENGPEAGMLCRELPEAGLWLCVPENTPGGEDLLSAICAMASPQSAAPTREDVYRRLLTGTLADSEAEAAAQPFRIPLKKRRTVLALRLRRAGSEPAAALLENVLPLQEGDALVPLDRQTAALIRDLTGRASAEETLQFAQALQETLANDTDLELVIGIGCPCAALRELRESCGQALRALELGRTFAPEKNILDYSALVP